MTDHIDGGLYRGAIGQPGHSYKTQGLDLIKQFHFPQGYLAPEAGVELFFEIAETRFERALVQHIAQQFSDPRWRPMIT